MKTEEVEMQIFKLISRDQRLAEKGISSMEEHTAEIKRKKIF